MNPAREWEPWRRGNQVIAAFINVIYHKGKGQGVVADSLARAASLQTDPPGLHAPTCLYELWGSIMGEETGTSPSNDPSHITSISSFRWPQFAFPKAGLYNRFTVHQCVIVEMHICVWKITQILEKK